MAIKKVAYKTGKIVYFIILLFLVGHLLPAPERYINYEVARKVALFIAGNENAEVMYDAYSYIDWVFMVIIIIPCYLLTIVLIKKVRGK